MCNSVVIVFQCPEYNITYSVFEIGVRFASVVVAESARKPCRVLTRLVSFPNEATSYVIGVGYRALCATLHLRVYITVHVYFVRR